ncbi:MAG: hypothetical protein AAF411_16745 [Myxococcota bacterium]
MKRALLLLLLACSEDPRTQIDLFIDADPDVEADVQSLQLCVEGAAAPAGFDTATPDCVEFSPSPTGDQLPLPAFGFRIAVVPEGNDATRVFRATATASVSSGAPVKASVQSGWIAGETLELRLLLRREDGCEAVTCVDNRVCLGSECVEPPIVDPCSLLRRDGTRACDNFDADVDLSVDAGVDASDMADAADTGDADAEVPDADAGDGDIIVDEPNRAFVSSEPLPVPLGMLGGDDADPHALADAHCQSLAEAAELNGIFVALLSTSRLSAVEKLQRASGEGWVNMNGETVAVSLDALTAGNLLHPVRYNELGDQVTRRVATGSQSDLSASVGRSLNCDDWTDPLGGLLPAGDPRSTRGLWLNDRITRRLRSDCTPTNREVCTTPEERPETDFVCGDDYEACSVACSRQLRVYCFQTDGTGSAAPPTPPAEPRYAFVTQDAIRSGGGVEVLDELCNNEGEELAPEAEFVALVTTATSSALARLRGTGPWIRPDGAVVADREQLSDGRLLTPVNQTATGDYTNVRTWSGDVGVRGENAGFTCGDWEAAPGGEAGVAHTGVSASTHLFDGIGGEFLANCLADDAEYRVLCFDNRPAPSDP